MLVTLQACHKAYADPSGDKQYTEQHDQCDAACSQQSEHSLIDVRGHPIGAHRRQVLPPPVGATSFREFPSIYFGGLLPVAFLYTNKYESIYRYRYTGTINELCDCADHPRCADFGLEGAP